MQTLLYSYLQKSWCELKKNIWENIVKSLFWSHRPFFSSSLPYVTQQLAHNKKMYARHLQNKFQSLQFLNLVGNSNHYKYLYLLKNSKIEIQVTMFLKFLASHHIYNTNTYHIKRLHTILKLCKFMHSYSIVCFRCLAHLLCEWCLVSLSACI